MALSPPWRHLRGLSNAIMEGGFSKQGADWQANDVSWVSHYAPAPQTPSVAPSPREIPCVDAQ